MRVVNRKLRNKIYIYTDILNSLKRPFLCELVKFSPAYDSDFIQQPTYEAEKYFFWTH